MEKTETAGTAATAEALAREYLRALQAKDRQAILAIIAEDFLLEVPYDVAGRNDLSDSWRGREAAETNFETAFRTIADTTYTDLEFTCGKDETVAFAEGMGVMTMANGRPYRNRYIFRFDTRNGKIRRIREYLNPVTAAISFGLPLPQSSDDGVGNRFV